MSVVQSIIHTPTPNLAESLGFFRKLNFRVVSETDPTLVTDGRVLIEINANRHARPGIKLFQESWETALSALEGQVHIHGHDGHWVLADPSGVWVYLVAGRAGPEFVPESESFGITGNFAGISLESTDMARSLAIYEALGFRNSGGSAEQGWISCHREEGFGISILAPFRCPHLFFNPSLTYFNGKEGNPRVIQKIRDAGIPITEEITCFHPDGVVDNIIIREPGGYGFFIFND